MLTFIGLTATEAISAFERVCLTCFGDRCCADLPWRSRKVLWSLKLHPSFHRKWWVDHEWRSFNVQNWWTYPLKDLLATLCQWWIKLLSDEERRCNIQIRTVLAWIINERTPEKQWHLWILPSVHLQARQSLVSRLLQPLLFDTSDTPSQWTSESAAVGCSAIPADWP